MVHAAQLFSINRDFPVDGKQVRILHDIETHFSLGQLTMIVGPSGCGKTTLISILSGLLSATTGKVEVMGTDLGQLSDHQNVLFRRTFVGFIFQQYNLLPALTVAENVAMPLTASGMNQREALAKARSLLQTIGMEAQTEKLPRQLSGGQQQRVAIARALVHEPRLVICDEPTAALDAQTGQQVMEILRGMADDASRAVLVVTHDNRIYHFADRIVQMSDGRLVGDDNAQDYLKKEGAL